MALANEKELNKARGTVTFPQGSTVVQFVANIPVELPPTERQRVIDALQDAFRKVMEELGMAYLLR